MILKGKKQKNKINTKYLLFEKLTKHYYKFKNHADNLISFMFQKKLNFFIFFFES